MSDSRERVNTYYEKNEDEKEPRIIKWKKEKGRGDRAMEEQGRAPGRSDLETRRVLGDERVRMIYLCFV